MFWSWNSWVPVTSKSFTKVHELISSAAPRLKDAVVPEEDLPRLYVELVVAMRRMYQQCRLVHGDLSEYNIL